MVTPISSDAVVDEQEHKNGAHDKPTENTAPTQPPKLTIGENSYECRDLSDITYNEQIQANQLLDRMSDLQETMREYSELDDEDDEWGDIPEAPPELEEAWRRFHKRVVRFAFPDAPKEELQTLNAAQVAQASAKFTSYLNRYSLEQSDAEGNADKPKGNRKSRRVSRKQSRG